MNELALFAGAGGGILGGKLLGWRTVCAVENDEHARNVLVARQNDGSIEPFPIWDDVRTFDGKSWHGIVDVVSGGFPCQDISDAGRRAGITGERSGLWFEMARIIGEVRPSFVFVENTYALVSRGLDRVLGCLAEVGYNAEWGVLGAYHAGLPHKRERVWIVAYSDKIRRDWLETKPQKRPEVFYNHVAQWRASLPVDLHPFMEPFHAGAGDTIGRIDDGLADAMDRLARVGNGQVPAVVRMAWRILLERAATGQWNAVSDKGACA